MSDFSIQFFPAQGGSNAKYLGGGYIKSGVVSVRFAVFRNEKFGQGFAISLPVRKNGEEWVDEVTFINKEASEAVYAEVARQLKGGSSSNGSNAGQAPRRPSAEDKPTLVERNKPKAGTGVPEELPF